MKLSPGDEVVVKKELKRGSDYMNFVNDTMEKFAGKQVTVLKITDDGIDIYINIEEDDGVFYWTLDMFNIKRFIIQ